MKNIFTVFLLIFLFSSSCYYSDPSTYEVEIVSDYNPSVEVLSNLGIHDSVAILDSLLFEYMISIDTGRLYFADLYIGNLLIYRSESLSDSIWIDPYYITVPGDYTLTMLAYYKSYSESLADLYNAEFIVYDTAWTLKFYNEISR